MAFPTSLDVTSPPGSQSIGLGDDRIRELKQFLADILGIPVLTAFSGPIATAGAAGGFGVGTVAGFFHSVRTNRVGMR